MDLETGNVNLTSGPITYLPCVFEQVTQLPELQFPHLQTGNKNNDCCNC
jgi:hypothetical protein